MNRIVSVYLSMIGCGWIINTFSETNDFRRRSVASLVIITTSRPYRKETHLVIMTRTVFASNTCSRSGYYGFYCIFLVLHFCRFLVPVPIQLVLPLFLCLLLLLLRRVVYGIRGILVVATATAIAIAIAIVIAIAIAK